LVLQCQARLHRFLLRKGVLAEDAKQLCQDAFLTLWLNRHRPRDPQAFLMGIASRLAMAYHRKRGRLQTVSIEAVSAEVQAAAVDDPPADPAPSTTPVVPLDKLTPRLREAIELVQVQGVSRADAARRLGIPAGTLRVRVKRALDILGEGAEQPHRRAQGKPLRDGRAEQ